MRIAVFHDLPDGGAHKALYELTKRLFPENFIDLYTFHRPHKNMLDFSLFVQAINSVAVPKAPLLPERLANDLQALWHARFASQRLAKIINRKKYNVVLITHTRFFQAPWILRYINAKKVFICQEPTRAFFEGFLDIDPSWPLPNRLYERAIRSIKKRVEVQNAKYADTTIANSAYSASYIANAYNIKTTPLLLGVDTEVFYPEKTKKKNQLMLVGNDEPQKNIDFALHVLSKIEKKLRPDLLIVSPRKDNFNRVSKLASELDVSLSVEKQVSPDKLRQHYNESLITLAVAHNEPFGLSVIESMACGTPVLAVDEAGYKETVLEGVTGWLLPKDDKKFANRLEKLLSNPKEISRLSTNCTSHVQKNFTWDNTVSQLLPLLKP